jgi:hypothetical protein
MSDALRKGYMNDSDKNEYSVETQDKFEGKLGSKDAANNSISNSLSRRRFWVAPLRPQL